MKSFITLALSALALAAPAADIEKRQLVVSNEFTLGVGCRDVIFIFARGSTEIYNMGEIVGPQLSTALKAGLGALNVMTEGVTYAALLSTNFWLENSDPVGVANMQGLFEAAALRCPTSKIVAAGYSQGAAVLHQAVQFTGALAKSKIAGVVTFGDTRRLQDLGRVPTYPPEKTKIICAPGDLVCDGTLIITPAHLTYTINVPEAASFLISRVRAS